MTHPNLNTHLVDTATPPIPEAAGWLAGYDGRFGPAINLSQAVPGDPPPQVFLDRISSAAASAEATRYGDIFGDEALRQAYARACSSLYGAPITPEETAITAGCNQAFFVSILAVAKAGDAVLLPSPWYFNHKMTLDMLGIEARPLPLSAERGFLPDAGAARPLIDDTVKAIVLVTPNNPTGAVYPAATVAAFKEMAFENNLWLVIDETYRDFLPGSSLHRAFTTPDWRSCVISLYSFSKSYAIPGHRVGAITAAAPVIEEIGKVLDCVQICPARAAQMALPWAMDNLTDWRQDVNATLADRLIAFQAALDLCPGWRLDQIGAYFAYVRHPFAGVSATAVAEHLAREFGLLVLPGSYFGPGQDDHLRFAFANVDAATIEKACERLALYAQTAAQTDIEARDQGHG
ncbi:aminotransferase [Roseibium hamelinense]|uniref:aminotransferase n=1 Tax=Roseibium hamelinense TaxID=150831 RepID=UPI001FCC922D|nr:aminotransferase [Roseibium hamelinense]